MKMTTMILHGLLALLLLIGACSSQTEPEHDLVTDEATVDPDKALPDKILIVYLSRTKNTRAVAEIIHSQVGGTLVALELEKPYPENYQATVQQVVRENETGSLPPLKTNVDRIQQYDVVFLGFPTWGMQLPPPMKSFLRQYDFRGKTIIPFNTNGGYGIGSSFETVNELCPDSKILEGFTTQGGSERDGHYLVLKGEKASEVEANVKRWLKKLKLI